MNANRSILLVGLASIFIFSFAPSTSAQSPRQNFICNDGYTQSECHEQATVLRAVLKKYPTQDLGDWSWVLVRSIDWERILFDRKLPPTIPAFTYLAKRETFFDEALLLAQSPRGIELSIAWSMTIPDLLDLAVRHEMGHALCQERDEAAARHTAQLLLDVPAISALQACRSKQPKTRYALPTKTATRSERNCRRARFLPPSGNKIYPIRKPVY